MSNPVTILEQALAGGLIHPGDDGGEPFAIPLPTFNNSAIPEEVRNQFAQDAGLPTSNIAKLVAEALVHALKTGGSALADDIKTRAEAAELPNMPAYHRPPPPNAATKGTRKPGKKHPTPLGNNTLTITVDDDPCTPEQFARQHLADPTSAKPWAQAALVVMGRKIALPDQDTEAWTMISHPGRIDITTSDT